MQERAIKRPVAKDRTSASNPKRARSGTSPSASHATLILCLPTLGMAAGRLPSFLALAVLVLIMAVLVFLSHLGRTRRTPRKGKTRVQEDR